MNERRLNVGVKELAASAEEARGNHTQTGEKQLIRHFTQRQSQCRSRSRQNRRSSKHTTESPGEFTVRHRRGCYRVDCSSNIFGCQAVKYGAKQVVERNPAHELASGT